MLDFTRENFDNVFSGFYSQTDTIWLLDAHKRLLYCSRSDYDETNMNEEEDTQYLWMQEPERGFYVILCRQAPISSPALQTMGNGASGHVPVKPGPVHDDLRRADTEYCKAGQPAG